MYDAAPMKILGLETSCDETGVAVYDSEHGLLAQELYSQIDLHKIYGGVVPEIASRDHVRCLLPLIKKYSPMIKRNICSLINNLGVINQSRCAKTENLCDQ